MFTFVNTLPYFVKMNAFSSYFRTLIRHFVNISGLRPDSVDNPLSGLNTACCRFVNSLLFREFVGYFAELFRRQFELFAVEIHVVFALNGDQMNVCMGHFEA